jgi:hypothetical protein
MLVIPTREKIKESGLQQTSNTISRTPVQVDNDRAYSGPCSFECVQAKVFQGNVKNGEDIKSSAGTR